MLVPTNGVSMEIHAADGRFGSSPVTGNIHELVDLVEAPESEARSNGTPRRPR
jgi:hypothetical protein